MGLFTIIALAGGALFIFLAFIVFLIVKDSGKAGAKGSSPAQAKRVFSTELEKMISTARDPSLSEAELKELALLFVKTHKLGSRPPGKLNEASKKKLDFISAFASNASASPKVVSFLNHELKKISASFKKEIDAYEQMGLAKRRIREK